MKVNQKPKQIHNRGGKGLFSLCHFWGWEGPENKLRSETEKTAGKKNRTKRANGVFERELQAVARVKWQLGWDFCGEKSALGRSLKGKKILDGV